MRGKKYKIVIYKNKIWIYTLTISTKLSKHALFLFVYEFFKLRKQPPFPWYEKNPTLSQNIEMPFQFNTTEMKVFNMEFNRAMLLKQYSVYDKKLLTVDEKNWVVTKRTTHSIIHIRDSNSNRDNEKSQRTTQKI